MADIVTFRGTTIYDGANGGGACGLLTPQPGGKEIIENAPPQGVGSFSKEGRKIERELSLQLIFHTATPFAVVVQIEGLRGATRGTLTVPVHGSFSNCALVSADVVRFEKSKLWLLEMKLTFRQY